MQSSCPAQAESVVADSQRGTRSAWVPSTVTFDHRLEHESQCASGCPRTCGVPGPHAQQPRVLAGAVLMVLERGATWPASFASRREGHEDVVVLAQQPDDASPALLRRVRCYVGELVAAGRCMRTAVLVASCPAPSEREVASRKALAQSLLASLCSCCGHLWLVEGADNQGLNRQLRHLASTLRDDAADGVDVLLEEASSLTSHASVSRRWLKPIASGATR